MVVRERAGNHQEGNASIVLIYSTYLAFHTNIRQNFPVVELERRERKTLRRVDKAARKRFDAIKR